MFANGLAAQTEGEEDSDRERESAVQEPGEKMSLTLASLQPVPLSCYQMGILPNLLLHLHHKPT